MRTPDLCKGSCIIDDVWCRVVGGNNAVELSRGSVGVRMYRFVVTVATARGVRVWGSVRGCFTFRIDRGLVPPEGRGSLMVSGSTGLKLFV